MVISVFVTLACVVILGSILVYLLPDLPIDIVRVNLNKLVLYIFLPALNFKVIYSAQIGSEFWQLPILAAASLFIAIFLGIIFYTFISVDRQVKGALIIAAAFSNVTYFGIAVLQGLFPAQAFEVIRVAVLFEITITPLALVVGSALAAIYGDQGKFSLKRSLLDVIKMPLLWATIIAFTLNLLKIHVPDFIINATNLLASTVAGLMILSLGMALKYPALIKALRRIYILLPVLLIKLILLPIIVFFGAKWLAVTEPYFQASVIEASMPSQLIGLVIADRFKLNVEILAIAIALDTVVSFFTIPCVHYFLIKYLT